MAMKLTDSRQDEGLIESQPADSARAAGIDRRSFIGAAAVMTGAALTPEVLAAQTPKDTKIVLTGIARSKGKAAGEALMNSQRMGWAFNHVGNELSVKNAD